MSENLLLDHTVIPWVEKEDLTHIFYCEKDDWNGWYELDSDGKKNWDKEKVDLFWTRFAILKIKRKDYNFTSIIFPESHAQFNHKEFGEHVDFSYAKFLWEIWIWNNIFLNWVCFDGAIFYERFDLFSTKIEGGIQASDTKFIWDFWIDRVEFKGESILSGCIFSREVVIMESVFGELDISDSVFQWNFHTFHSEFKNSNFSRSKFLEWANFENIIFNNEVNFTNSTFHNETKFENVWFAGEWNFSKAYFSKEKPTIFEYDNSYLSWGSNIPKLRLSNIVFNSNCVFRKWNFSKVIFLNSKIDTIRFEECEFKEKNWNLILFDEMEAKTTDELLEMEDVKNWSFEQIENLYCQFKFNFEEKKSWQIAGDFHIGEMRMRTKRLKSEANRKWNNWFMKNLFFVFNDEWWAVLSERITLFVYKLVSNYWESIGRPFVWIILFIAIVSCSIVLISHKPVLDSFLMGFRSMTFQKEDDFSSLSLSIKWILSVTQVVWILLIAMLTLAIGRKTKR